MFKKLFGKKSSVDEGDSKKNAKYKRSQTVDTGSLSKRTEDDLVEKRAEKKTAKPPAETHALDTGKKRRKKQKKECGEVQIDANKPLEYPCTPELIMEYHKKKSFLSQNEEWLVVELNEYECLVDSEDIIKVIAKHSKFFELDPPELWEEFFEFVEDVPSYDEVINYDVWQEFRDKCYPC